MSMPKQETTKKGRVFEIYKKYEEYKLEGIWNNTVFAKEPEASHLLVGNLLL